MGKGGDAQIWMRRCVRCLVDYPMREFQHGGSKRRVCAACRRERDKQAHRNLRANPEKNTRIKEARAERRRQRRLSPALQSAYRQRQRSSYEKYLEQEKIKARERRAAYFDGIDRVYFILSVELQRIKIGFSSSHPQYRLKCMETGSADELRLLGWVPATRDDEKRLHDLFRHLHIRKEWFRADPELTAYIKASSVEAADG